MKNTLKNFLAILISAAMLLSAAACSKVPESGEKGEGTAKVDENGNVVSNPNAEAIRAEIRQKAADIIATLEVGKTYDEIPITAKKLGVERFCSTIYWEGSAAQSAAIYVDLTKGQVCWEPEYFNYYLPVWFMGENDTIEKIYYQLDKKVVPYEDVSEYDCSNLSELYAETGYDIWAFDEDELPYFDFTYKGTEEVDGFGETLVFEAIYGLDYNKYNIDPETGFWVKYVCKSGVETVGDGIAYYFDVKDIIIEPDYYVPDFENDTVDYSEFTGFATLEEAAEEWLTAVKNNDLDAVAAMIPHSEEAYNEYYNDYGGATPKQLCSIISAEATAYLHFVADYYCGIAADEMQLVIYEEQVLTEGVAGYNDLEDAVYRIYCVEGADEECGIHAMFVKEKGRGWSVFALSYAY